MRVYGKLCLGRDCEGTGELIEICSSFDQSSRVGEGKGPSDLLVIDYWGNGVKTMKCRVFDFLFIQNFVEFFY